MDGKGGIMCKLKGRMDKGGQYDVEIKGWMQKGAILCATSKGRWIREGTIMCK